MSGPVGKSDLSCITAMQVLRVPLTGEEAALARGLTARLCQIEAFQRTKLDAAGRHLRTHLLAHLLTDGLLTV